MTKVIIQNGQMGEFKSFGIRKYKGDVYAVSGTVENGNVYQLGRYHDYFTAVHLMAALVQYEGAEPFKMPGEETVTPL